MYYNNVLHCLPLFEIYIYIKYIKTVSKITRNRILNNNNKKNNNYKLKENTKINET